MVDGLDVHDRLRPLHARAKEFEEKLLSAVAGLESGDPMDGATDIGPLAREDLRSNLERQVQVAASVSAGARVLAGGRIREGPGFFFEPTVLIDVTREMPVFQEETFGPVAVMLRASSDNDAVASRTIHLSDLEATSGRPTSARRLRSLAVSKPEASSSTE